MLLSVLRFILALSLLFIPLVHASGNADAEGDSGTELHFAFVEWQPFYYQVNGHYEGLMHELLEELLVRRLGVSLVNVPRPWARAQFEVEHGTADFMVTVPTAARETYAVSSELPLLTIRLGLYTYADHPRLEQIRQATSIEDLRNLGLVAVTNAGNQWHKLNVEEQGIETVVTSTDESIPRMLAAHRADIMIDSIVAMNDIIQRSGLSDRLVLTELRFDAVNMHLLMSRKSEHLGLMDDIDKAMKEMQDTGIFAGLLQKYEKL